MIGMLFWVGSAVAIGVAATVKSDAPQQSAKALRKANLVVTAPAMVLAWIGGLGMLVPNFSEVYARAGWMHGKLTLLLVLAGLTGVLSGKLRRAANGTQEVPGKTFCILWVAMAVIAAVIVSLAVFRPGG